MNSRLLSIVPFLFAASLWNSLQMTMSWVIVVLGIGILIFIHELGHFAVAKYEKVRVIAFALGFGPSIWHKKWGETEYHLKLLPLGGYVKLAGETPGVEAVGAADEFMSKSPGPRARILLAGVTMNFIFGLLTVIVAFQIGVYFPAPVLGGIMPGSPAWHAGLQPGDEIIEMNGQRITKFREIGLNIAFSSRDSMIQFKVKRGDNVLAYELQPEYDEEMGLLLIGVQPCLDTLHVPENSPLYALGLRTGDKILEVNDKKLQDGYDFHEALALLRDQPKLQLLVERDGQKHALEITPQKKAVHRLGIVAQQLCLGAVRRNSAAAKLGLQKQDKILAIAQKPLLTRKDFEKAILESPNPVLTVQSKAPAEPRDIPINFAELKINPKDFMDDLYFVPDLTIGEVVADSPAAAYLNPGDTIVAINDQEISAWSQLSPIIAASKGNALQMVVLRNSEKFSFSIQPAVYQEFDLGNLVFLPKLSEAQSYNIWESCKYGLKDAYQMILDVFFMLKGLISQDIAAKNLGGPVVIFSASYSQLQLGFGYFLYFLALISINLAVVNLLPIPILDGGHLFFLSIEKIRGKPVSERVIGIFNAIGMAFLLTLLLFVTYNDILRLF